MSEPIHPAEPITEAQHIDNLEKIPQQIETLKQALEQDPDMNTDLKTSIQDTIATMEKYREPLLQKKTLSQEDANSLQANLKQMEQNNNTLKTRAQAYYENAPEHTTYQAHNQCFMCWQNSVAWGIILSGVIIL